MHITVIGTGFVGVVSAAVYASFGHQVMGLDIDPDKIASLTQGSVPFFEPHLEQLLIDQQATGNLRFTTDYQEAVTNADIIVIAVGTPSAADGQADLTYVFAAAESAAAHFKPGVILVVKSTVPPGTLEAVKHHVDPIATQPYFLASVPEFLREGSAVYDTLHPDRVVIGATEPEVLNRLKELHKPLKAPIIEVTPASAQMAKYAANAYLASRITFANQIADLCQRNGADVQQVLKAISPDQRIGGHYWYPGFGYGGSCFPKDVKELAAYSRAIGEGDNIFNKINDLNEARIPRLMSHFDQEVGGWKNKKVAVLGLAFKPNTDDMREAPSLKVIPHLLQAGATVVGYDPKAHWPAEAANPGFTQVVSLKEAIADAQVIIVLIEWPEIISFSFVQIDPLPIADQRRWFIDARNQFDPDQVATWGFEYRGIGR